MRTPSSAVEDLSGDAWERISESLRDARVAPDHGEEERRVFDACERRDRVAEPLSRVTTAKLKTALITVAVHFLRSGGEKVPLVTAADVKKASRMSVLARMERLVSRSEEDSQMLAIAIEYSLH